MGYEALTAAEIAVKKPVTNALMTKIKDNFAYFYGKTQSGIPPANGSFEIDSDSDGLPDNWSTSLYAGGSRGLYTTDPVHGGQALYFTHPGGAGNGGGFAESDYFEVSELITSYLAFTLWATAAGMKVMAGIRQFDKDKVAVSGYEYTYLYTSTSNPTSQTAKFLQFTPAATACYCKVVLVGGYTDTDVAGTVYFDDVFVLPAVVGEMIEEATAGDYAELFLSEDQTQTGETSYTKTVEVKVFRPGTYRVKFYLRSDVNGYTAYGRIYVNGVATGTERSVTSDAIGTYYSEDITVEAGDLIQIYCKSNADKAAIVGRVRICTGNPIRPSYDYQYGEVS